MAAGLPLYISVAQLTEQAGEPYAWGIFDAYPSADTGRPPMLWGIARNASQLRTIAARYGLAQRLKLCASHDINADIRDRTNCRRALCIAHRGTFAHWSRRLDWLYHRPPAAMQTGLSRQALAELAARYCQQHSVGLSTGRYLTHYLLAHAARQANRPKPVAARVELLYSSAGTDAPSRAHPVVGTTARHVIVDRLPFYAGGFLLPGWSGYALYTLRLPRAELDAGGLIQHKPSGLTFYKAEQAHRFPRHAEHLQQLDDDLDEDGDEYDAPASLVELPASSLQWAIELLALPQWPIDGAALKRAYRSAMQYAHPDKGGSAIYFQQIRAAYAYLATLNT